MIPFSPPRIDQKIIDEVVDTLRSGWITTGPKTKLFEKKLSAYCGHPATLCVNSNSAGMELMLRWLGIGAGDEVIVPAYTYCATANVVVHCGATPVMVDVDENCLISVAAIEKAITKNTKAIIVVDVFGMPVDYDEINALVNKPTIKSLFTPQTKEQETLGRMMVMADAAHSIGATYKGKKTGGLCDTSVFSFHAVKNLTTAEGGAICLNLPAPFNNEEIYRYLCTKSLHGQTKDALAKNQLGGWKYDVIEAGYKINMTDIMASMGLVELERYDNDTLVKRSYIYDEYVRLLGSHDWAELPLFETQDKTSSYHIFLLRIKGIDEETRNLIIDDIAKQGVTVNVHYQPLPMLTFYKQSNNIKDFPVAYKNYCNAISLPVFYDLTDEQIQTVVNAVVTSVEKFRK